MLPAIRCFSCGKPIGDKYEQYKTLTNAGKNPVEAFEELGLERYCCRRMWLGHTDLAEEIKKYPRF
ncbi:MAG: DNA-directed RNA polymerase subunit N [Candidatus Micrarchaeota archaeon]